MRFLLRMTFWIGLVLVLLPGGGAQTTTHVSALEAMSAAMATVGDMRSFCERQADACAIGSQAATVIGQRAQAGARKLYDYWSEHRDGTTARPAAQPSQHTLTPADMAPAWRGPSPARKERPA